ncbi:MAG: VanZ family protein [Anaeromassilibacillus sp.]|nr:VanZ family protein [Anaeromassilibacillus sp.]MDY3779095.1 VanZ family protein [Candidatus Limousia pullorum]
MIVIDDVFLIGFFGLIVGCIVTFILKVKTEKIIFWSAVYIYIVVVLGLTLFPIPYQGIEFFDSVPNNFIPFSTITATLKMGITSTSLIQIVGNIIIAAPYGVIIYLAMRKKKRIWLFLLPLLFPIVIESLQFFIGLIIGYNYRSIDIDDFILNSLGAYFGILFGKIFLSGLGDRIFNKFFANQNDD